MSKPMIDDIPEQLHLFGPFKDLEEEITSEKDDRLNWLDDVIKDEHIGSAKVFACNPDTCTDDCNKCRIFGGR